MLTARSLVSLVTLVSCATPFVAHARPLLHAQPAAIVMVDRVALSEERNRLHDERLRIMRRAERNKAFGTFAMAFGGAQAVLGVATLGADFGLMAITGAAIFYGGKLMYSRPFPEIRYAELTRRLAEIEVVLRAGRTAGTGTEVSRGTFTRPGMLVHPRDTGAGSGTER